MGLLLPRSSASEAAERLLLGWVLGVTIPCYVKSAAGCRVPEGTILEPLRRLRFWPSCAATGRLRVVPRTVGGLDFSPGCCWFLDRMICAIPSRTFLE